jgi:hypothetical protein
MYNGGFDISQHLSVGRHKARIVHDRTGAEISGEFPGREIKARIEIKKATILRKARLSLLVKAKDDIHYLTLQRKNSKDLAGTNAFIALELRPAMQAGYKDDLHEYEYIWDLPTDIEISDYAVVPKRLYAN